MFCIKQKQVNKYMGFYFVDFELGDTRGLC